MTARVVGELTGTIGWGQATWDPTGTKIAAIRFDSADRFASEIDVIDPETGAVTAVPGTSGAYRVTWTNEGIVFTRLRSGELLMVPAAGGAPISLLDRSVFYYESLWFTRETPDHPGGRRRRSGRAP